MKNLLTLFVLLISAGMYSQEQFVCGVPDRAITPPTSELIAKTPDGILCSKVYVQVDYDIVADKGRSGAENWARALMAEAAVPYADVEVELSYVFEFLESEYYTDGSSYDMLQQFRQRADQFDADAAMLISYKASGGIAWVDQACLTTGGYRYGFANVRPEFLPFRQGYSWNVEVVAHEMGHLYGSPHLQDCAWMVDGVGGQALEGCYQGNGNCNDGPIPDNGGQIMGYCHIRAGVGINFDLGFNTQVADIIRTTVYNRCETCDNPGDGGDPPIVECEDNPLFINLILDDYPDETKYIVTNAEGDTVHQNGPFARYAADGSRMAGEVITDTLCLPDGCYAFTIIDKNGLGVDDCNEGLYYVGDPFGEISSGQAFVNEETTRFCLGVTPPDGDCHEVILRQDSLTDYANQSRFPFPLITNEGENGVEVYGNNWRALAYDYEITPYTELTFDATNLTTGEIQGVSLVNNVSWIYPDRTFQFAGTQDWGIPIVPVTEGETNTLTIAVGRYFTGPMTHFVLVNDDDTFGVVRTRWENVVFCENDGAEIVTKSALPGAQGKAEDENWNDTETDMQEWIKRRISPSPNPVDDTLNLNTVAMWHLYGADGKKIDEGLGNKVDMSLLPPGLYLFHDGFKIHKIIKR